MFGWLREKNESALEAQILETSEHCVRVFTETWREANPQTRTHEELSNEIERFALAAFQFMFANYPVMKRAPAKTPWMMISTAVRDANTHIEADVAKAIENIRSRYAE